MQVQVSTDNNISGSDSLTQHVQSVVDAHLDRFSEQITRVEVHLSDENSHKGGDSDKKCVIEVRPAGMQPVVVTHKAATVDDAIDEAAEKMERLLDSTFGKLDTQKGRTSYGGDQTI